ncbi:MAG: hypothetical protein WCA49_24560 [Candidatus Sulfotelmatobacter sp.]
MSRKWFNIAALIAAATLSFNLSSCGFNQHLVSIQVTPNPVVFEGIGAQVQFTALGTYIHPPETKDITSQVQWRIDISYLATINSSGVAVATGLCGAGNAIATVYSDPSNPSSGSVVEGSAAISGADQANTSICP